uniref:Uncharacterized protein n=1 Tax=Arundo donax TaxID=35708 RepID=A0A0A9G3W9_ARUDO
MLSLVEKKTRVMPHFTHKKESCTNGGSYPWSKSQKATIF